MFVAPLSRRASRKRRCSSLTIAGRLLLRGAMPSPITAAALLFMFIVLPPACASDSVVEHLRCFCVLVLEILRTDGSDRARDALRCFQVRVADDAARILRQERARVCPVPAISFSEIIDDAARIHALEVSLLAVFSDALCALDDLFRVETARCVRVRAVFARLLDDIDAPVFAKHARADRDRALARALRADERDRVALRLTDFRAVHVTRTSAARPLDLIADVNALMTADARACELGGHRC